MPQILMGVLTVAGVRTVSRLDILDPLHTATMSVIMRIRNANSMMILNFMRHHGVEEELERNGGINDDTTHISPPPEDLAEA
ncbi:MAG: hypothetical protein FWD75_07010 [Propionibacteriaceae bacterium]|nr:hypothetical protein [Propionibacteriaceae bacterium]